MISGGGKFEEFKPARRVFAGRGRSMLTFGEWKISIFSMIFGGAVVGAWFYGSSNNGEIVFLAQPPLTNPPSIVAQTSSKPNFASEAVEASIETDLGQQAADYYIAQTASIVTGDTFYLEGVPVQLGLWGIETPKPDEPGFSESSAALAALVADRTLSCENVGNQERGRIIARCYFEDGSELSQELVNVGAASPTAQNL